MRMRANHQGSALPAMHHATPPMLCRRTLLVSALSAAGLHSLGANYAHAAAGLRVANITGLYTVPVARIATPGSTAEVSALLRSWPGQVAVGGGRYSMGGQVAVQDGLHIDMRQMKALLWLHASERRARMQAGMRWRDLQDHLDPVGLAVKTMQSYANFTVGGSVSVNAHGRYVGHGPVSHSVMALQLVMADGRVLETSPTAHAELFRAAIGGYGAVGVITEVELALADNLHIERVVQDVALESYVAHFHQQVLADPRSVLHNADLLPPHFNAPVSVTWRRAADGLPLTETTRLVPRGQRYAMAQNVIWAATELPGGSRLRKALVHPLLKARPAVKRLNHEASLDAAELEPRTRTMSTYVLQEYFVPERGFLGFARAMAEVLRSHDVEALNVSIRHAAADRVALLPWAREDVFSFVLYYKQRTHHAAQTAVGRWTRELITAALQHEGRYYLPYQLHATQAQFNQAYPEAVSLRRLKAQVDPQGRLSNELWRRYL